MCIFTTNIQFLFSQKRVAQWLPIIWSFKTAFTFHRCTTISMIHLHLHLHTHITPAKGYNWYRRFALFIFFHLRQYFFIDRFFKYRLFFQGEGGQYSTRTITDNPMQSFYPSPSWGTSSRDRITFLPPVYGY